jgi:hypothetical protein
MRTQPDKLRAKAIIVEIIRQAGGTLHNKTNLFKAFWRAHVAYAETHLTALSDWPIVRMPMGPGIDKFDLLLGELMGAGIVETQQVDRGGFTGFVFHLVSDVPSLLNEDEQAAIKAGVELVDGKSAAQVSESSHEFSRAWREATDGDELDIFLDAIPEAEHQQLSATARELSEAFDKEFAR